MRRRALLVSLVAAVGGLMAVGARSGAVAQEGTPPPFEIAPGVTGEALAFAPGAEAPALYRLTFEPGVTYAIEPSPAISLVYGEVGALTFALDAPITVTRAGATDAPGEGVAAGDEFELAAGDYATFPPLVGGEVRNDGEAAASVVVAEIVPDGMATPAAGTPES